MIDIGVLNTYERDSGFKGCVLDKVEGYGQIYPGFADYPIKGTLVTYKTGFSREFLFIADKPVIDYDNIVGFDKYFFHEGIFADSIADGRCWFISRATHHDNLISTNHDGVFTKCECFRGLIV